MAHEKGHPIRDRDSTTYVSSFSPIQEFGPMLRQEAICRGLALALQVVLLIDAAAIWHLRQQGFFIGSGVVEAGCKTVIGARCKQSGMFWGKRGAENILALRCIHASRRLDDFWKMRLNAHAARNDCLALAA